MIAIPGKSYRPNHRFEKSIEDITVVTLAHSPGSDQRDMVIYRYADTDAETGLCYYMPAWTFYHNYKEIAE